MNKKNIFRFLLIISTSFCLFLNSCATPSPLNGVWADNRGDQITFMPDMSYTAKIKSSFDENNSYSGIYSVLMNAITFNSENGYRVVSEWDIRGNMLYLEWPDSKGEKLQLTLYKIKN